MLEDILHTTITLAPKLESLLRVEKSMNDAVGITLRVSKEDPNMGCHSA